VLGDLLDLVLPAACSGCGRTGAPAALCAACTEALRGVRPQRVRSARDPAGMPPTYALAAYDGALRGALLAYKERNRHALATPLGDLLATVVARGLAALDGSGGSGDRAGGARPVLLVPVPDNAAAIRRRHGDHMVRLAVRAARALRANGVPAAVAGVLRAFPRPDSAELSAAERRATALGAFAALPARAAAVRAAAAGGAAVVLVDDILTTGSTVAATTERLAAVGVRVDYSAVLAATQRRQSSAHLHRT
jgi:predicted amidophosphoribosyltransferase